MTGFGRAECKLAKATIIVEIRTVNHRYLKFSYSVPDVFVSRISDLEAELKKGISRGSVQYRLRIEGENRFQDIAFNSSLLERYYRLLEASARRLKVSEPLHLELLALLPGVALLKEDEEARALWRALLTATRRALRNLLQARATEGKAILKDLRGYLTEMTGHLGSVRRRAPLVLEACKKKFCRQIRSLLASKAPAQEASIIREAAVFAQRSDISEEIARLEEHLRQMRRLLRSSGPIGRRVEFLSQEMEREVNTMSAKCPDIVASRHMLELKSQVDRIRQQAMNLE